jgi:NAD(P)-dependent dehydrogenase (short-subunit alcohol dehydrogenase family)
MKQDRVVVITGAAGGMGSVLVDRFLANGDTIVATDRDAALEILRAKVGANTRLQALGQRRAAPRLQLRRLYLRRQPSRQILQPVLHAFSG